MTISDSDLNVIKLAMANATTEGKLTMPIRGTSLVELDAADLICAGHTAQMDYWETDELKATVTCEVAVSALQAAVEAYENPQ